MPQRDLTLTMGTNNGATVIRVAGELDLSTIAAFDAEIQDSLRASHVIIELSECTFLDSSALRSLVHANRAANDVESRLAIVAPSQPARRVLDVSGLDRVIPVFDTIAEAVTAS